MQRTAAQITADLNEYKARLHRAATCDDADLFTELIEAAQEEQRHASRPRVSRGVALPPVYSTNPTLDALILGASKQGTHTAKLPPARIEGIEDHLRSIGAVTWSIGTAAYYKARGEGLELWVGVMSPECISIRLSAA